MCVCARARQKKEFVYVGIRVGWGGGGVWRNQKCAEEKSLVVVVKGAEIKVSVHV